ncbi:hypothetical protein [Anatilimnocola floriformis]|uniref:hypothetical protein n=1 Tax=Anatilimnocola floriformis TaxID=2948575 RepID=UPI0020C242E0|nr:hypothetical protein [Anatilimnocola floriformis]
MTAQINDAFHLDSVDYSLAGISEGDLFDPTLLGIEPVGTCTACYRGYQAVFGIADERLVLKTLHANLMRDTKSYLRIAGPPINGVTPTGEKGEHDWFNNHYENINYYLEYSGGILVADEFIRDLYVHMGFHPAWKYKRVRELIFESGRLLSNKDRSKQMAELRQSFLASRDMSDSSHMPSRKEIERFVEQAFDRTYPV